MAEGTDVIQPISWIFVSIFGFVWFWVHMCGWGAPGGAESETLAAALAGSWMIGDGKVEACEEEGPSGLPVI